MRREAAAGAHDQVIALFHTVQQALDISRVVLPVTVHEDNIFASGRPGAGFDGSPVTLGIGVGDHPHPGTLTHFHSPVSGAIVDHDNIGFRVELTQGWQECREPLLFILGRDDNGKLQWLLLQI